MNGRLLASARDGLESIGPFQDIDLMIEQSQYPSHWVNPISQRTNTKLNIGYAPMENNKSENETK